MTTLHLAPLTRFDDPGTATAPAPPEARGLARDGVRLLVAGGAGLTHARFSDLPSFLEPPLDRNQALDTAVDGNPSVHRRRL